jgi:polyhydroxyalkanoate synthesis regulator phasin
MDSRDKEPKDKRPLAEAFERFWSQALATVTNAEEEAGKWVGKVAQAAGWSPEEIKRQVNELGERLSSQRVQAEKGLDEAVKKTLARVKVPRAAELQALNARLDAVSRRLEALTK